MSDKQPLTVADFVNITTFTSNATANITVDQGVLVQSSISRIVEAINSLGQKDAKTELKIVLVEQQKD